MRERETGRSIDLAARAAPLFRGLAIVSLVGLCAVLMTVAAVAAVAEFHQTWIWYFRMEQSISTATPVSAVLTVTALVGAFGVVFTVPRK